MLLQTKQEASELKNLCFLTEKHPDKQNKKELQKSVQYKKYLYHTKDNTQCVTLTPREDECFWSYYQYRNIKAVATRMNISARTVEGHLGLIRKKFQMQTLKLLMDAVEKRVVECVISK